MTQCPRWVYPKWVLIVGAQRDFRAYHEARERCVNTTNKDYAQYGGRGIKFELASLEDLLLELGLSPEGYTLDRKDLSGHYHPDNVKWSAPKEPASSRSMSQGQAGRTGISIRANCFVVNYNGKHVGSCKTLEEAIKLKGTLEEVTELKATLQAARLETTTAPKETT